LLAAQVRPTLPVFGGICGSTKTTSGINPIAKHHQNSGQTPMKAGFACQAAIAMLPHRVTAVIDSFFLLAEKSEYRLNILIFAARSF
jgi:hypothetical protein